MASNPPESGKMKEVSTTAIGSGVNDLDDPQFACYLCLELLYKPVVISCGHILCFWCGYKAMDIIRESHCTVCSQPYKHFPGICQLLHRLLIKIEPAEYKRREKEVLEEERQLRKHSPQIIEFFNSKNNGSIVDEDSKKIKLEDVSCPLCKEMLYQPAVLNCGHVYCVSCLSSLNDEALKCHVCGSLHPGDFPNVCLDLDHFLEEYFPAEYVSREQKVEFKKGQCNREGSSSGTSCANGSSRAQHAEDLSNVHAGVGCDSCGVYPLRGKRYKCQDCTELIGFDLCEVCYNSSSKLPGRFNQQHTPDHRMRLDNSANYQRILDMMFIPGADALEEDEMMIQEAAAPGATVQVAINNQGMEGG